jgi:hypothetical protein
MPGGGKAVFDEGKKIAATSLIVVENRSHGQNHLLYKIVK